MTRPNPFSIPRIWTYFFKLAQKSFINRDCEYTEWCFVLPGSRSWEIRKFFECTRRGAMTSAVLAAAQAALSIDGSIGEGIPSPKGEMQGRTVTHWSYKLFITGSVIGVIAAIAAYIFAMPAISVISMLLAVTNGFAAFYVKRFGVLKTLEDYTARLSEKVSNLKEVNQDLERVQEGLEVIPENYRSEIERGRTEIAEKTSELEKVANKLRATEAKLKNLAKITSDMQIKMGDLSAEAVKFSQQNHMYGERVDRLAAEVDEVQRHSDKMETLILETDANTTEYEALNQQFVLQLKMLDDLFELMKELYLKAQEKMNLLESQVDELGLVVPQAVKSAEEAQELHEQMHAMEMRYREIAAQLERTVHTVKRYNKYKAAYRELKEMKACPNWPKIQALLH
jgi:hypothetical protein